MNIFTIITSILLIITAFVNLHVGIGYYQILRWLTMTCSILWAINFYNKNQNLFITFCVISILFNPIVPIYLNKPLWKIIDIIVGMIFIINVLKKKTNT